MKSRDNRRMPRDPATFAYNEPYPLTSVSDQPDAACVDCSDELKYPSTELTTIKVHRPRRPDGHWLVYCSEHLAEYMLSDHSEDEQEPVAPRAKRSSASKAKAGAASGAGAKATATGKATAAAKASAKREPVPERVAVMCPDCFVEASLSGTCPMCGEPISA